MRGSIRKRGKRWAVVIPLGREPRPGEPDATRVRQLFKSFPTRADAQAFCAQVIGQLQAGEYVRPAKQRLGAFLTEWLDKYAAGAVQPTTLAGYRDIARAVTQRLGVVPLARLTPAMIQGYYTEKRAEGLSPTTVHAHHRLLRLALGHAERWCLIPRNPAVRTNPPRPQRVERRV
jgi:integrase